MSTMEDPLQYPSYLEGPMVTVLLSYNKLNSGDVSLHDVTEAFSLLDTRVRDQAKALNKGGEFPAIEAIKNKGPAAPTAIMFAIRGAILLALQPPISADQPSTSTGRRKLTLGEAKRARDAACLCQAAIRFTADIFALRGLQSLLGSYQLSMLLESILDVASTDTLPSFNPIKTYAYMIKSLGMMNLPGAILEKYSDRIADTLMGALRGKMGQKTKCFPHAEAVDAACNLLDTAPHIFLPVFKDLIPILYGYLTHQTKSMRLFGCKALSTFAKVIYRTPLPMELRLSYSEKVAEIIAQDVSKSMRPDAVSLQKLFLVSRESATFAADAAFALITMSSLIILSGPLVFTRPKSLKLIIKPFENAKALRTSFNSRILTTVWRCLVWSFSKLHDWGVTEAHPRIIEQAYHLVKQEGGRDLNVALVACLLSLRASSDISLGLALETLKTMVGEDSIVRTAGIGILHILLYGHEDWSTELEDDLIPKNVFDHHILHQKESRIRETIANFPAIQTSTAQPISESDVCTHWSAILHMWNLAVESEMRSRAGTLYTRLQDIWQALLAIPARLAKTAVPPEVSNRTLLSLTNAYNLILSRSQEEPGITEKQSLAIVLQMWEIAKDEFNHSTLQQMSPKILEHLLDSKYRRKDPDAQKSFETLYRELLFTNVKGALAIWNDRTRRLQDDKHSRELFKMFRKYIIDDGVAIALDDFAVLLAFPLDWRKHDLDLCKDWYDMFRRANSQAIQEGRHVDIITNPLCDELGRRTFSYTRIEPIGVVLQLIRAVLERKSEFDELKHTKLIQVASQCIRETYPPIPEKPLCQGVKEILGFYRRLLQSCNGMDSFRVLMGGLLPWMEDKRSLVSDEDYNKLIIPIYSDFIKAASLLPLDVIFSDTEMVDILTSVFSKASIPPPAAGVVDFANFCESRLPQVRLNKKDCPQKLLLCIHALVDAYNITIPDWLQSESQVERSNANITHPVASNIVSIFGTPTRLPGIVVIPETPLSMRETEQGPRLVQSPRSFVANSSSPEPYHRSPPPRRHSQKRNFTAPGDSKSTESSSISEKGSPQVSIMKHEHPSSDGQDYSMWDAGLSSQDVRELRASDNPANLDDTSSHRPMSPDIDESQMDICNDTTTSFDNEPMLNPNDGDRRVGRSQTAPAALDPSSASDNGPAASLSTTPAEVRAHGLRRTRTTALETVQQLHNVVSNDVHVMETQDLAQFANQLHQMQGIVQARITRKLESKRDTSPSLFD